MLEYGFDRANVYLDRKITVDSGIAQLCPFPKALSYLIFEIALLGKNLNSLYGRKRLGWRTVIVHHQSG